MILIGTSDGLYELDGGSARRIMEGEIRAIGGGWAVAGQEVVLLGADTRLPLDGVQPLCVAPVGGGALVGTAGARLFRLSTDRGVEPVRGFDAIPTRDDWYTPWGAPPDTRSLATGADGAWFVNVHVGGVWRSIDGGVSWREVVAVDRDTHQVVAKDGRLVAAAAAGFGWSVDDGENWSWTTAGLHAGYCRAVALADSHELVTASTGPSTSQGALYRRPVGSDEPFERCATGLPEWFGHNLDTFQLAANGERVALGTRDGVLRVSDDAGTSFSVAAEGLPPIRAVAFA